MTRTRRACGTTLLLGSVPLILRSSTLASSHRGRFLYHPLPNSLLTMTLLNQPLDVVLYVAQTVAEMSTHAAEDLVALFSTNRHLYALGQDPQFSEPWRMAHLTQFGTKPPELHARPWRQLVLERLRLSGSPTVKLAMYLIRNYEPHTNVKYVIIYLHICALSDSIYAHGTATQRPLWRAR